MADPERNENKNMEEKEEEVVPVSQENDDNISTDLSCLDLNATPIPQICPPSVKRRIKALKRLQLESIRMDYRFSAEVQSMGCQYFKTNHQAILNKRSQITRGEYEPKDEECDWPSDDEEKQEEKISEMKDLTTDEKGEAKENENNITDNVKGIPDFWLTIFKSVGMLAEMVQKHDEPILQHLVDVKVQILESDSMGFILEFHFDPNEYFTNKILTKRYQMTFIDLATSPFTFEEPVINQCRGCYIQWKEGKDVTFKRVEKILKFQPPGTPLIYMETVANVSFFNFFNPPTIPVDHEGQLDADAQVLLLRDYKIGHFIKDRIIPQAILYYTGEALIHEGHDHYSTYFTPSDAKTIGANKYSTDLTPVRATAPETSSSSRGKCTLH